VLSDLQWEEVDLCYVVFEVLHLVRRKNVRNLLMKVVSSELGEKDEKTEKRAVFHQHGLRETWVVIT
jgi:hypothetical protein